MGHWKRIVAWCLGAVVVSLVMLWLGTLLHEGAHGLVAAAVGARITEMNVIFVDLYPTIQFHHEPGYYGYVTFDRPLPYPQDAVMSAAGSLSTFVVALLAQGVWWSRLERRPRWVWLVVGVLCFFWLDLAWHTLPVLLGWRGAVFAEAIGALDALGVPFAWAGWTSIGLSALLLILTLIRGRQLLRWASESQPDKMGVCT